MRASALLAHLGEAHGAQLADSDLSERLEGEPLPTSYGHDLYRRIFDTAPQPADAARSNPSL